jgi:hypothetical protein
VGTGSRTGMRGETLFLALSCVPGSKLASADDWSTVGLDILSIADVN